MIFVYTLYSNAHFIPQCTLYPIVHTLYPRMHTLYHSVHTLPHSAQKIPVNRVATLSHSAHLIPQCPLYPKMPTFYPFFVFIPHKSHPWVSDKHTKPPITRVMLCLLVFSNSNSLIHYFTTSMLLHENLEPSNWTKWGQRTMNNLLFLTTVTAR